MTYYGISEFLLPSSSSYKVWNEEEDVWVGAFDSGEGEWNMKQDKFSQISLKKECQRKKTITYEGIYWEEEIYNLKEIIWTE